MIDIINNTKTSLINYSAQDISRVH